MRLEPGEREVLRNLGIWMGAGCVFIAVAEHYIFLLLWFAWAALAYFLYRLRGYWYLYETEEERVGVFFSSLGVALMIGLGLRWVLWG